MSANLGQVQAHESELVLLDQLIEQVPDDHPGSVQLRLQRVMAELATDRMLDADQSLRKLRDPVRELAKSSHDEPALRFIASLSLPGCPYPAR
ncbi:MAG: hypothetical protein HC898_02790 [Phycisphaerales bacterium]|nr:hypothetical protein [Phycisphaerales bacterium]